MAQLRWTRRGRWTDSNRGIDVTGPGVYEVPEDAVDEYLAHQSGGWEQPWGDEDDGGEPDDLDRDELEGAGYRKLQNLAKERDIPANQSEEELIDALAE